MVIGVFHIALGNCEQNLIQFNLINLNVLSISMFINVYHIITCNWIFLIFSSTYFKNIASVTIQSPSQWTLSNFDCRLKLLNLQKKLYGLYVLKQIIYIIITNVQTSDDNQSKNNHNHRNSPTYLKEFCSYNLFKKTYQTLSI